MARVRFTAHLSRFFPGLAELEVDAATVADVVRALEARHRGLAAYLVDERGALRKHVNIFVDSSAVVDRENLSDLVRPQTTITIFQALSGG